MYLLKSSKRFLVGSLLMLLPLLMALPFPALAFERPTDDIEEAVSNAETIFLGRVTEAKEVEYCDVRIRAVAKVLVVRHLRGAECRAGLVTLAYTIRNYGADENGADFNVGTLYLFAFRPGRVKNACDVAFTSKWGKGGTDFAFKAAEELKADKGVAFASIYGRSGYQVLSLTDLEKLERTTRR